MFNAISFPEHARSRVNSTVLKPVIEAGTHSHRGQAIYGVLTSILSSLSAVIPWMVDYRLVYNTKHISRQLQNVSLTLIILSCARSKLQLNSDVSGIEDDAYQTFPLCNHHFIMQNVGLRSWRFFGGFLERIFNANARLSSSSRASHPNFCQPAPSLVPAPRIRIEYSL